MSYILQGLTDADYRLEVAKGRDRLTVSKEAMQYFSF
jgi:hypothetical protein